MFIGAACVMHDAARCHLMPQCRSATSSPAKVFTLRRDTASIAAAALPALLLLLLFLLFLLWLPLLLLLFAGCCVELRDCRVCCCGMQASIACWLGKW